ncbi:substrate-binding domain-containing protein [Sphaerisporangium melleum]|uniref:substrate-binding domain-containing protein n=1 Tax=Sphaerisporangium melleum TaxID=321316 RepID=UPI0016676214|nr:substrate-binding domain-containing protein [Sphaerisporangium melleum]
MTGRPNSAFTVDIALRYDLLTPAITVVAQDPIGLGRTSAEPLFRRLAGENGPVELIRLPTRLTPRGSGELPPP